MTARLDLDALHDAFGPAPDRGNLPDGVIDGTGRADWAAVIALLRERAGHLDWLTADHDALPIELASFDRLHAAGEVPAFAAQLSDRVQLHVWHFDDASVDFDLDLNALTSQADVDVLSAALVALSDATARDVLIFSEGADEQRVPPTLRYDHAAGEFTLHPWHAGR